MGYDQFTGEMQFSSPFAGTSLPATNSLSVSAPHGGTAEASYDFKDDGNTAEFSIVTIYSGVTGTSAFQEQGADLGVVPIAFRTTREVHYSFTVSSSATSNTDSTYLPYGVLLLQNGVEELHISNQDGGLNHTFQQSGTFSANALIALQATVAIGQLANITSSQMASGSSSVRLTITAVPEPTHVATLSSGLLLIAVLTTRSLKRGQRPNK